MTDNITFWFGFLCGFLVAWILMLILHLLRGISNEEI